MAPFISPVELGAYLGRTPDTAMATLAVNGATGLIQEFCQWPIAAETTTFVMDGTGSTLLALPTLRLTAVTAVTIDGVAITDYQWSERGHLYRSARWPAQMRAVSVACSHGYAPIPDAVRAVAFGLAANLLANPEGLRAKTVGGVSRQFETALTELQLAQLAGYRLP